MKKKFKLRYRVFANLIDTILLLGLSNLLFLLADAYLKNLLATFIIGITVLIFTNYYYVYSISKYGRTIGGKQYNLYYTNSNTGKNMSTYESLKYVLYSQFFTIITSTFYSIIDLLNLSTIPYNEDIVVYFIYTIFLPSIFYLYYNYVYYREHGRTGVWWDTKTNTSVTNK